MEHVFPFFFFGEEVLLMRHFMGCQVDFLSLVLVNFRAKHTGLNVFSIYTYGQKSILIAHINLSIKGVKAIFKLV